MIEKCEILPIFKATMKFAEATAELTKIIAPKTKQCHTCDDRNECPYFQMGMGMADSLKGHSPEKPRSSHLGLINNVKLFPIVGGWVFIRWELAEKVYEGYVKEHGKIQTLERIAERGGWGINEVNRYLGDASPFKEEN